MPSSKLKTLVQSVPPVFRILKWLQKPYLRVKGRCRSTIRSGLETLRDIRFEYLRHLCRAMTEMVASPVFAKVGANDGTTDDPCSDLLLKSPNWQGLLIEPVPYCFERLKLKFTDSRRFKLDRAAVGPFSSDTIFYYVDSKAAENIPDLPGWYDQLGSFSRDHIMKHLNGVLEPYIVESNVEVVPLTAILERNHIEDLHLLHIDTEGFDYEVLRTLDFARYQPWVIFIEHVHLEDAARKELMRLMKQNHYTVRDCGVDFLAVRKSMSQNIQWKARRIQLKSVMSRAKRAISKKPQHLDCKDLSPE